MDEKLTPAEIMAKAAFEREGPREEGSWEGLKQRCRPIAESWIDDMRAALNSGEERS